MSTVKIKTEPTATTITAAAVDVKVKLEQSLSTTDIKLEQHTSDVDTKVESNSDIDSEEDEEDYIKSENNDDSDVGNDQSERQFICKHPGCGRRFNSTRYLRVHQHEHRLQTELYFHGKTYTLTRQSLDDRWACPVPGCTSTAITVNAAGGHIRIIHERQRQQQQPPSQIIHRKLYFVGVDNFHVNGILCGYHTTIGVFVCQQCKLVPECLVTHLQQKHGYDEKSIDNSALPDSAVNAGADPNINQHASNSHLASAISQPYQQHHQDILQGWLCVTSDCGYCGYTAANKCKHKKHFHQIEQLATVPALILRLALSKSSSSYFFITRIDQASGAVKTSSNRRNQYRFDYSHNGLNVQDESEDDANQNETTSASNQKRQWKCDYDNCGLFFNSARQLSIHRREHKCETALIVQGETFTLIRQSADDRWACPVPDCETTCKAIYSTRAHILRTHLTSAKQKRANTEEDDNKQSTKRRQQTWLYLKVDDFYVNGTKCGYHTTTGLFMCYECKLVPECLFTHLQQKHAFDEKSIDNAFLPESARKLGSDPNINQYTANPQLAAAIREPSQLQHPDIVHGWICIAFDCGYCCSTKAARYNHQYSEHRGEQISAVPALVLRLLYSKERASFSLITRLDTTSSITKQFKLASQYKSEDDDGDGDELVLSDYSDENDIH